MTLNLPRFPDLAGLRRPRRSGARGARWPRARCWSMSSRSECTMGALEAALRQGKALYVGISSYPEKQTREAHRLLNEMGVPCLIHQPSY